MRIDAHQHFWDLDRFAYPWMPPAPSPLRRDFLPEDLKPILERNRMDGSVVVQATTDAGEAAWLLELADKHSFIRGVVVWVDLTSSDLPHTLDTLQKHPAFKGVRHPVHDEADHRWLLRADVLEGLRELERRGIPYDLLLRPQHLKPSMELVDKLPSLKMVIDHIAKPLIADRRMEGWAEDMEQISMAPNVYVKLSGMITEADWGLWTSDHLRPYVQHVWNHFGADRCMFGSDWPVCLLAGQRRTATSLLKSDCRPPSLPGGYSRAGIWKETLAGLTQAMGPVPQEARNKLMGGTAAAFYKLHGA